MTTYDYSHVTQEMFDDALAGILDGMTARQLLTIPGVYEAVSEELNNDVLATFEPDWNGPTSVPVSESVMGRRP